MPTVTIAADADEVAEGQDATLTLTRDGDLTNSLTVNVSKRQSSRPGVSLLDVTFEPSNSTAPLVISTDDDEIYRVGDRLTVRIQAGEGYQIGAPDTASITVTDNDVPTGITLSLNPAVVEEDAGSTQVTVTASSVGGIVRAAPTEVSVSVAGGTAGAEDFTPVDAFDLIIPAQAASATAMFTFTPTDDEIDESDETLTVSGVDGTDPYVPVTPATLTIADDELPTVTIATDATVVAEGEDITATLTRDGYLANSLTVTVSKHQVSEQIVQILTVTFDPLSSSSSLTISAKEDQIYEAGDRLVVRIDGGDNYRIGSPDHVIIAVTDNDVPTGITLSLNPAVVEEDAGLTRVTVTASSVDGIVRGVPTEVTVSVAGNTAGAEDFTPVDDFVLTIPVRAVSGTAMFIFTPVNDAIAEGDETLTVSGVDGTDPHVPVTGATLTLGDDDSASTGVALTLQPDEVSEDGGEQTVTVTATLNAGARTEDTVVQVTVEAGTALAADYTATSVTLTIPANQAARHRDPHGDAGGRRHCRGR